MPDFGWLPVSTGAPGTVAATTASAPGASSEAGAHVADAAWGTLVGVTNHGRGAWYLRDLGAGDVVLTHVFWAN